MEAAHEGEHGVVGAAGGLQAEQTGRQAVSQRAVPRAGGPAAAQTNPWPERSGAAADKLLPLTACWSGSSSAIRHRKLFYWPI